LSDTKRRGVIVEVLWGWPFSFNPPSFLGCRNQLFGFFDLDGGSHVIRKDDDASPVLYVKTFRGSHELALLVNGVTQPENMRFFDGFHEETIRESNGAFLICEDCQNFLALLPLYQWDESS
jgi:hypothetical protein